MLASMGPGLCQCTDSWNVGKPVLHGTLQAYGLGLISQGDKELKLSYHHLGIRQRIVFRE